MKAVLYLAACSAVLGCNTSPPPASLDKYCQSHRPQMCTREYRPVCGLNMQNQWQNFGNGCSACATAGIKGYNEQACPP